jgi:hypothetical protein
VLEVGGATLFPVETWFLPLRFRRDRRRTLADTLSMWCR